MDQNDAILGKVFMLFKPRPCILTQPEAISKYLLEGTSLLADASLDNDEFNQVETQIQEFISLAASVITPNVANITHPLFGAKGQDKALSSISETQVKTVLETLEKQLLYNTFLVTERMTLADLAVASSLTLLFRSGKFELPNNYQCITRWFKTVAFQEEYIQAQGNNPLTNFPEIAMTLDGKAFAQIQKDLKSGNFGEKEVKKEVKKEASAPGDSAAPQQEMDPKKLAKLQAKEKAKAEKLAKLKAKQEKAAAAKAQKDQQVFQKKCTQFLLKTDIFQQILC